MGVLPAYPCRDCTPSLAQDKFRRSAWLGDRHQQKVGSARLRQGTVLVTISFSHVSEVSTLIVSDITLRSFCKSCQKEMIPFEFTRVQVLFPDHSSASLPGSVLLFSGASESDLPVPGYEDERTKSEAHPSRLQKSRLAELFTVR